MKLLRRIKAPAPRDPLVGRLFEYRHYCLAVLTEPNDKGWRKMVECDRDRGYHFGLYTNEWWVRITLNNVDDERPYKLEFSRTEYVAEASGTNTFHGRAVDHPVDDIQQEVMRVAMDLIEQQPWLT